MPIPFPKLHIAESVKNRILNTWDELQTSRAEPPQPPAAPTAPAMPADTVTAGAELDVRTQAPAPPMAEPGGLAGSDMGGAVARGEDMLQNVGGIFNTAIRPGNEK